MTEGIEVSVLGQEFGMSSSRRCLGPLTDCQMYVKSGLSWALLAFRDTEEEEEDGVSKRKQLANNLTRNHRVTEIGPEEQLHRYFDTSRLQRSTALSNGRHRRRDI